MKDDSLLPGLNKLARGGSLFTAGVISQNAFNYLTFIIITRFLGPPLFGVFVIVNTIFRFAGMAGAMGIDRGLIRLAACLKARGSFAEIRDAFSYASKAAAISSVLTGAALFFFAPFLAEMFLQSRELAWTIMAAGCAVPFFSLGGIWLSGMQGLQVPRHRIYTEKFFQPALTCVLAASLLLAGLRLEAVIAAMIAPVVAGAGIALNRLRRILPPATRAEVRTDSRKELLASSGLLLFSAVLNLLLIKTDVMMLGYFRTSAETGIYGAAARAAFLILIPFFSFNEIFSPEIAELSTCKKTPRLNYVSKNLARWTVTLSFPLFIILFFLPGPVMSLLGGGFEAGAGILMILGAGYMVQSAAGSPGYIISMSGRIKLDFLNSLLACTLNFILNYFLIPRHGMYGAAAATAASFTAVNIARAVQARLLFNVNPLSAGMVKPFISGLAAAGALLLCRSGFPPEGPAPHRILLCACLALAVFAAALYSLKLNSMDRDIIKKALRRRQSGKLK